MEIIKLEKISPASPSQWNILLEDDEQNKIDIYVRYRWGEMKFMVMKDRTEHEGEIVYLENIGDGYDGVMSTREMLKIFFSYVIDDLKVKEEK